MGGKQAAPDNSELEKQRADERAKNAAAMNARRRRGAGINALLAGSADPSLALMGFQSAGRTVG
ncbi:hypothetical protein [Ferrovibrio sp.]|uniref:hypothetical protein n=1 Tax=Ferrovibrio sp. TaxID=1917215 RepID=UPI003D0E9EA2